MIVARTKALTGIFGFESFLSVGQSTDGDRWVDLTGQGEATDATGIQLAGVLDNLFAYDGPLGANATKDGVSINVWAPTAQVIIVSS